MALFGRFFPTRIAALVAVSVTGSQTAASVTGSQISYASYSGAYYNTHQPSKSPIYEDLPDIPQANDEIESVLSADNHSTYSGYTNPSAPANAYQYYNHNDYGYNYAGSSSYANYGQQQNNSAYATYNGT